MIAGLSWAGLTTPTLYLSLRQTKMLPKLFLTPLLAFLRQHHRLCLACRIGDHPLLVQPIHRTPIVPFPCTSVSVQCEIKKREHHLIDFFFIVVHEAILTLHGEISIALP